MFHIGFLRTFMMYYSSTGSLAIPIKLKTKFSADFSTDIVLHSKNEWPKEILFLFVKSIHTQTISSIFLW
jgi:hypothetical protein